MFSKLKPLFINGSKRNLAATALMLICISIMSVVLIGFVTTRELLINDEGVVKKIATTKTYVSEVLDDEQVILGEYDEINYDGDTKVAEIQEINIDRAVPAYINVDGQRLEVMTAKDTVGELLASQNITLGELDEVSPAVSENVYSGLEVTVCRITVEYWDRFLPLPFETATVANAEQYESYQRVTQQGEEGINKQTIKDVKRDGVLISGAVISEEITKQPVKHIIEKGTKAKPKVVTNQGISSPGSGSGFQLGKKEKSANFTYSRVLTCNATAYDASAESNGAYAGRTASGMKMQYGVIAVDPRVIPLGTKLYIESTDGGKSWVYGYAIAGDTGGAIKGNKIDLFFWSRADVNNFGRRNATVYVLD